MSFLPSRSRSVVLAALAFLAVGSLAAAVERARRNHVDLPLTCSLCDNKLTEIVVHLRGSNLGVPAYVATMDEVSHETRFALADGEKFSVMDQDGLTEVVTFHASGFADLSQAAPAEVVAAMNGQLTLAQASLHNGNLLLRGVKGGALSTLTPDNVTGTPLDTLMIQAGEMMPGADHVGLALSIPAGDEPAPGAFAGLPYRVLVSATEGTTDLGGGLTLPIATDGLTRAFLRAAASGLVPTLVGALDSHSDASAEIPLDALQALLGSAPPAKLFMAFVVTSADGTQPLYVSNRFTATLVH